MVRHQPDEGHIYWRENEPGTVPGDDSEMFKKKTACNWVVFLISAHGVFFLVISQPGRNLIIE